MTEVAACAVVALPTTAAVVEAAWAVSALLAAAMMTEVTWTALVLPRTAVAATTAAVGSRRRCRCQQQQSGRSAYCEDQGWFGELLRWVWGRRYSEGCTRRTAPVVGEVVIGWLAAGS